MNDPDADAAAATLAATLHDDDDDGDDNWSPSYTKQEKEKQVTSNPILFSLGTPYTHTGSR